MRRTEPPFIATWLLEHFTPGDRNKVLAGDLMEEFRNGRSASWYWQQVLIAIVIRWWGEIRAHSLALAFAAIWCIPVRVWWFFALWHAAHTVGYILPPPYSTDLGMFISVVLTIWIGLITYALTYAAIAHTMNLERVVRGFATGPMVFLLLTFVNKIWPYRPGFNAASFGSLEVVAYFLSLIVAIWTVEPSSLRAAQHADING